MQFEEMLKREHKEGYEEGIKEGHKAGQTEGSQQILELVSRMMNDGKADMISRLKADEAFYKEMLEKYHL